MAPNTTRLFALASLSPVAIAVLLAAWSFSLPIPKTDPQTGFSSSRPSLAIPILMPSDADEYFVPLHGNFERWEYAPWERKWYRLNSGISMAIPISLLMVPLVIWTG